MMYAANEFIDGPGGFYEYVMKIAEVRGLHDFESCLFAVSCSICGELILFTHENEDWTSEVRPTLLESFKD